ncbi:DUF4397 domain-containing protein [Pinibacter aurantiacus]|uniref:DUF4397 domain-containing protein n=1 Tax=Pinibacter aurantiacus TaxID=2851599 RepID=A0A9E2S528_9BACT|nr:DUF4397 domain-containing protein [Pinibacter aurantiacus]MBV4355767.1 DUF4397 domain-containing protein [Pinibacter aurantiacus]
MKSLFSILLVGIIICSCNKETDQVSEGSQAKLTVGNFVLNGIPVDVSVSGKLITTQPVSFGKFSGDTANPYTLFTPGFSNIKLSPAGYPDSNLLTKSNFVFGTASAFSFFLFDSVPTTTLYVVQDLPQLVDTAAKVRFFNFVKGTDKDSLTVYLIRHLLIGNRPDTVNLTKWLTNSSNKPNQLSRAYAGVDDIDYSGFNTIVYQDTAYHIHVYHNNELVDSSQKVAINLRSHYSFVAVGSYYYNNFTDPTLYKPTIKVMKNY